MERSEVDQRNDGVLKLDQTTACSSEFDCKHNRLSIASIECVIFFCVVTEDILTKSGQAKERERERERKREREREESKDSLL
jgi:hypothetical protein